MITPRRKLPPLNALRAFEVAGRRLSFRAAADELGVTQGAVAQQVLAGSLSQELLCGRMCDGLELVFGPPPGRQIPRRG